MLARYVGLKKALQIHGQISLNVLECLGYTKGNCCPHYDEEPERKPSLSNFISNGEISDCFAIDGGCVFKLIYIKTFEE